jgi:hypothetical protein
MSPQQLSHPTFSVVLEILYRVSRQGQPGIRGSQAVRLQSEALSIPILRPLDGIGFGGEQGDGPS